jgi:hypothetical protein
MGEKAGAVIRRRWRVLVDKVSSAVPMDPSFADQWKEAELEAKRMERDERRRVDPTGLGVWGVEETIEEVVRRQNQQ